MKTLSGEIKEVRQILEGVVDKVTIRKKPTTTNTGLRIGRFSIDHATTWAPAEPVTDISTQVRPHLLAMYRELERTGAISLAAQQVGLPLRFFVWRAYREGMRFTQVVINPVLTWSIEEVDTQMDADQSRPGIRLPIARPTAIKVDYLTAAGGYVTGHHLIGIAARVFLHEIDRQEGRSGFRQAAIGAPRPPPGKESI